MKRNESNRHGNALRKMRLEILSVIYHSTVFSTDFINLTSVDALLNRWDPVRKCEWHAGQIPRLQVCQQSSPGQAIRHPRRRPAPSDRHAESARESAPGNRASTCADLQSTRNRCPRHPRHDQSDRLLARRTKKDEEVPQMTNDIDLKLSRDRRKVNIYLTRYFISHVEE